jgi:hypothetical protein
MVIADMRRRIASGGVAAFAIASGLWSGAAVADVLTCRMSYDIKGWSPGYKTAHGHGTVACSNGTSMQVSLEAQGDGLSAGTSHINDGYGSFTGMKSIDGIAGDYVSAGAEAGAVRPGEATVLTKGDVSLALRGAGSGWNAGVSFNRLTVERATAKTVSDKKPASRNTGAPVRTAGPRPAP